MESTLYPLVRREGVARVQGKYNKLQDLSLSVTPGMGHVEALHHLVQDFMAAVSAGEVRITCCFVKRIPFSTQGKLVPVELPCGCTMSYAASESAVSSGMCPLCYEPLPKNTECQINDTVLRVVQAEKHGYGVDEISRINIQLSREIATGSQGTVWQGELMNDGSKKNRAVAVKKVPLPEEWSPQDVGSLQQVMSTWFLASNCAHVCKLHGASWSKTEVWYASSMIRPLQQDSACYSCFHGTVNLEIVSRVAHDLAVRAVEIVQAVAHAKPQQRKCWYDAGLLPPSPTYHDSTYNYV